VYFTLALALFPWLGYLVPQPRFRRGGPGQLAPAQDGTSCAGYRYDEGYPMSKTSAFSFRFDPAARYLLPVLGVTPATSGIQVADGQVSVRYGPWHTTVDRRNIRAVTASGPFRTWKAIGPRLSLADRGLTFGSSTRGGVCIQFRRPVGVLAGRLLAHPALTVTVDRPAELIRLLQPSRLNRLSLVNLLSKARAAGRQ
jgi:hypothetical protein